MVHNLDPFIIQFTENFGLRWYGFAYVMGFVAAYFIINWLAQRQRIGMTSEQVSDFITYGAFGVLLGGRLGYVFFYDPSLLTKFKADLPYWGVLAVNEGGMASHGGILGLMIATLIYARKTGIQKLYLLDLCAIVGPVGIFFGRIANFINGELVGRPSAPDFPLAVKFPQDILSWPASEVEKLNSLQGAAEMVGVQRDQWALWVQNSGTDHSASQQVYATLQKIIVQIQEGNQALTQVLEPLLIARHPSQLYAAFGEGLFLFLFLFFMWRTAKKPGVIAAWFGILYSIVRISDEFFRMPDADIGLNALGLSRGQMLSGAMFLLGIILLFLWSRTSSSMINGWGRAQNVKVGRR